MQTFWLDGYDYEVNTDDLKIHENTCYLWDTQQGWMKIQVLEHQGVLNVADCCPVIARPIDSLVAHHRGAGMQLREREATYSNAEALQL